MQVQLGQARVQLMSTISEKDTGVRSVMLTSVYNVSYAVLRASRPSSTLCVQGPICTVRMRSGLTTVSLYKLGNKVSKWSRMRCGRERAAELSAESARRRTV